MSHHIRTLAAFILGAALAAGGTAAATQQAQPTDPAARCVVWRDLTTQACRVDFTDDGPKHINKIRVMAYIDGEFQIGFTWWPGAYYKPGEGQPGRLQTHRVVGR